MNSDSFKIPDGHYTHQDLIHLLAGGESCVSENSAQWMIYDLINEGKIVREGYNSYSSAGEELPPYVPAYSPLSRRLMKRISEEFPDISFTVIETQLLNEFLNHQIAQNTIYIQAEKDVSSYVFRMLQKDKKLYCLYKPTQQDMEYQWKKNCIVVYGRISESPVNRSRSHDVTAEKLIVDLYCDRYLKKAYARSEYSSVVRQIREHYRINEAGLFRYARRRNKEKEIRVIMEGSSC